MSSIIFLAAAVIAVPLFKKFGLASVLGYLAAGSVLGPFGVNLVNDPHRLIKSSEIGIVMLLFIIGLELKPSRLWTMRRQVFGAGAAQVLLTAGLLALAGPLFGLSWMLSMVVGLALSLSSTAFALQLLSERGQVNTQFGRMSFSILLFQDLVAIPFLALIPFLSPVSVAGGIGHRWWSVGLVVAVIAALPFILRPVLRIVASTRIRELFTAITLLLVLGLALLMEQAGLSMALGSFIGGILLSDSEYRHQLEADIEPFKGLLLGLFFIAIGMGVNYGLLFEQPRMILMLVLGVMLVKGLSVYGVGRLFGLKSEGARQMAAVLPQGGEFAFVIFAVGLTSGLMNEGEVDILNLIITLSMAATPLATLLNDRLLDRFRNALPPEYDQIPPENNLVIVAGFGRFGQIIGRILRMLDMEFTALEQDPEQVEVLRKFGSKVYYGDASRLDLLEAAGAKSARYFIVCIDEQEASLRTVDVVRAHFPHLKIFARARNRRHAFLLLDRKIQIIYRETLGSSLEMAEHLLTSLGYPSAVARATITRFRAHDEETLLKQHAVYQDEKLLIRTSKEAAQQLTEVLKADKREPAVSSI